MKGKLQPGLGGAAGSAGGDARKGRANAVLLGSCSINIRSNLSARGWEGKEGRAGFLWVGGRQGWARTASS